MIQYHFRPCFKTQQVGAGVYSVSELADETGVYSATPAFVRQHCGPIANMFLAAVPDSYYTLADTLHLYPNCDVRIHRLYPSDYPAYPGWHCDGEFRETYFSQPDLDRIPVQQHIIATASTCLGGVSNTQFLNEPFEFASEEVSADFPLWQQVNEKLARQRPLSAFDTQDGELVFFDAWTLHRAMPAKIRGWRLFFRMSMWHKPNLGEGGKISKQEQVYKYVGDAGW